MFLSEAYFAVVLFLLIEGKFFKSYIMNQMLFGFSH